MRMTSCWKLRMKLVTSWLCMAIPELEWRFCFEYALRLVADGRISEELLNELQDGDLPWMCFDHQMEIFSLIDRVARAKSRWRATGDFAANTWYKSVLSIRNKLTGILPDETTDALKHAYALQLVSRGFESGTTLFMLDEDGLDVFSKKHRNCFIIWRDYVT